MAAAAAAAAAALEEDEICGHCYIGLGCLCPLVNGNHPPHPTAHATQHPCPSDPKSTVRTTLPLFAKGAQAQLKNSGRQLN